VTKPPTIVGLSRFLIFRRFVIVITFQIRRYYFEVTEALTFGKYVGWIGKDFWVFEITGAEEPNETEVPSE